MPAKCPTKLSAVLMRQELQNAKNALTYFFTVGAVRFFIFIKAGGHTQKGKSMYRKNDRIKLWFAKDWFNALIDILYYVNDYTKSSIKSGHMFSDDLIDNEKLISKIMRYGWYEENEDGKEEVRIELFPSEARDLIWQLLNYSVLTFKSAEGCSHYENFKEIHDSIKNGEMKVPKILHPYSAEYLYENYKLGCEFLVKNKDENIFFVDHGYSGKLIKKEDHWEDAEYGFDENVFIPVNSHINIDIVSWDDEEPLDIYKYLSENAWLKNGEFQKNPAFGFCSKVEELEATNERLKKEIAFLQNLGSDER